MSETPVAQPAKLPKGQFRCFKCRKTFLMREGNWHRWEQMEVHLCIACERLTRGAAERK